MWEFIDESHSMKNVVFIFFFFERVKKILYFYKVAVIYMSWIVWLRQRQTEADVSLWQLLKGIDNNFLLQGKSFQYYEHLKFLGLFSF